MKTILTLSILICGCCFSQVSSKDIGRVREVPPIPVYDAEVLSVPAVLLVGGVDPLTRADWSVLIKTENGTVSLIRNLPLIEAVKVFEAMADKRGPGFHTVNPGDVRDRQILGPGDWDGCLKAMKHKFELKDGVCEGGPNKGLKFRSGTCSLCGAHKFEWVDKPNQ